MSENRPLSAFNPRLPKFRSIDYRVLNDELSEKAARADVDVDLLGKHTRQVVVRYAFLEECERLARQSLLVANHAEFALGAAVALLQNEDAQGAIRTIESLNMAQKHMSGLIARSLVNIIHARRTHFLPSTLSSATQASLLHLPLPLEGSLFGGNIAESVRKDLESSSHSTIAKLASKLSNSSVPKPKVATNTATPNKGTSKPTFKIPFKPFRKNNSKNHQGAQNKTSK